MTIKNIFTKIHGHLRSFSFTKSFNENIREYPIAHKKYLRKFAVIVLRIPSGLPFGRDHASLVHGYSR